MILNRRTGLAVAIFTFGWAVSLADPGVISKWSFDDGGAANAVPGAPGGKVERAVPGEGKAGRALHFEDWSTRNYLKPDPRIATRVVVPHDPKLNPAHPFRVTAWIYPTADPVYYGGIVEKGHGYGASYRLVLLRGLKVEASLGAGHVTARSPLPITLNGWHQVALVSDGKSLTLIVDGADVARTAITAEVKLGSVEPLIIGERFTGRIDEVSIGTD